MSIRCPGESVAAMPSFTTSFSPQHDACIATKGAWPGQPAATGMAGQEGASTDCITAVPGCRLCAGLLSQPQQCCSRCMSPAGDGVHTMQSSPGLSAVREHSPLYLSDDPPGQGEPLRRAAPRQRRAQGTGGGTTARGGVTTPASDRRRGRRPATRQHGSCGHSPVCWASIVRCARTTLLRSYRPGDALSATPYAAQAATSRG
jgi:hypothetical protein